MFELSFVRTSNFFFFLHDCTFVAPRMVSSFFFLKFREVQMPCIEVQFSFPQK